MSRDHRYFLANEAGQAADDRHGLGGHRRAHRPLRRGQPGRVLRAGPGFRRDRGVREAVERRPESARPNSGFNQRHAGYLHLSPPQALAFGGSGTTCPTATSTAPTASRRSSTTSSGTSCHQGALTDLGQLTNLLDVAQALHDRPSGGRNLLEFASEMHALTGKNLALEHAAHRDHAEQRHGQRGAPGRGHRQPAATGGTSSRTRSASPPRSSRGPAAKKKPASIPPASTVTVDVYNGGTTDGLAAAVSQALVSAGYQAGATGSPAAQSQTVRPPPRCSTAPGRRPTRRRSRVTSGRPPPRPVRWRPGMWRSCSARPPRRCPPAGGLLVKLAHVPSGQREFGGQQRPGGRGGDGQGERQVRDSLRVLTA